MTAVATLRIGELARISGRSAHAIRWYDDQGLMPGVVRDAAGRRCFNERHVSWLALLDRLRSTGMSIAQIRAYTQVVRQGPARLAQQRDLLAAHRDRVCASIDEWRAALALIDAKLAFYDQWLSTGVRPASEAATRSARTPRPRSRRSA